jgi:hypothetical protein
VAESGLLGSRCSPGTQEIKISAWGKVDVDRTGKVRGSGKKHPRIGIPTMGGSDPATVPLLYDGEFLPINHVRTISALYNVYIYIHTYILCMYIGARWHR